MKISKFSLRTIFLFLIVTGTAFTSTNDESWKIFDDTAVGEVKIIINPAFLNFILDPANAESDSLFPATFIYKNAVISGDTLYDIGFRIRGNTSRQSAKKSFKIDINHFVPGRQFYNLEKLNLNGEHNDPSIIRSKLCWDLFQAIGVPASCANHIKLFINNQYQGLYINVEHVDDEFVQKRFGNQNGNLYKCLCPADLVYCGADQAIYKREYNGRRAYDLMTNKTEEDYSDLVHFIDVLNNTPQSLLKPELEKIFAVDNFLKWLALNVLVGSWDDYWYLKNNYYLYHNTATDRFEFIPYDYDNTYGIDWVGGDWGTRNIYNWGNPSEPRPLITRILSVPEYKNSYTQYLVNYISNEFAFERQQPRIDRIRALITPAAEADSFRTLDWDFSIEDFHQSFAGPVASHTGHVPYGIKPYIQTRIASVRSQINYINIPPNIDHVEHSPLNPEPNQPVNILADVTDNNQVINVRLYYRTSDSNFLSQLMYDDGNHNDGNANDGRCCVQIPQQPNGTVIYYFVEAQDNQLTLTKKPPSAPENSFYYVSRQASNSEVLVKFYFKKLLHPGDVGVGLLGSFNDWNKIYPMKDNGSDFWELACFLPPGNYIYKFVTYKNLNGSAGVTEWIADPENPERDGDPYFNAVLNVTDPMIYYIKPLNQDTVFNNRPEISAAFARSRNTTIPPASIIFKIDGQPIDPAGNYYDLKTNEFHYSPTASLSQGKHEIYLSVQNSQGKFFEQSSEFFVLAPLLFINEFMANNVNTIVDEHGDADDWIEIYNGDSVAISLKGMFLTDKLTRPQKWLLPDIMLKAGGFLFVWADGDTSQGAFHANFKLSADSEQIGLFNSVAMGNSPIDTLSFGPQTSDISYGRNPDASDHWEFMPPTPKIFNVTFTTVSIAENSLPAKFELWQNYPNPFHAKTIIRFVVEKDCRVVLKLYDILGQEVQVLTDRFYSKGIYHLKMEASEIASGLYFYRIQMGEFADVRKMVVLR